MKQHNIQIAIVDDDTLIVQLLSEFLEQQENFKICLTANSGNSFLEQLREIENTPDIVLLDLCMQDGDGLQVIDTLTQQHYPQIKIIVLSSYYKTSSIGYMLKLGVHAFIPKETDKEDLMHIIEVVYKKDYYFTAEQIAVLRK